MKIQKLILAIFVIFLLVFGVSGLALATDYVAKVTDIDGTTVTYSIDTDGNLVLKGGATLTSITATGALTFTGAVAIGEDLAITADANDEEFTFTTSSRAPSGLGVVRFINTSRAMDTQNYILELKHWSGLTADDAEADFFVCYKSSNNDVAFMIDQSGCLIGDDGEKLDLGSGTDGTIILSDGTNAALTMVDGGSTFSSTFNGSLDVSGGSITLQEDETIVNSTDDSVQVKSNDADTRFIVGSVADKDGEILIQADASADNGDDWLEKNDDGDSNKLIFYNDVSGSPVAKLTLSTGGDVLAATSFSIGANTLTTTEWAYLDGTNQGLKTTDGVTHRDVAATYGVTGATAIFTGDMKALSFSIGANTLTTSEWAYLDGQNQALKTTDSPTFANATYTYGIKVQTITILGASSYLDPAGLNITYGVVCGTVEASGYVKGLSVSATGGDVTASDDLIATGNSLFLGTTENATYDGSSKITISTLTVFQDGADCNGKTLVNCGNAGTDFGTDGSLTTAAGITATSSDITAGDDLFASGNSLYLGTTENATYDGSAQINISTSVNVVDGAITAGKNITAGTGMTSTTGNILATAGYHGQVDSGCGGSIYTIEVSSLMVQAGEIEVTGINGKAGWFEIVMGTHTAIGSFTVDAVVTLAPVPSADSTTTNNSSGHLNVYDAGATIKIENQILETKQMFGWVRYKN